MDHNYTLFWLQFSTVTTAIQLSLDKSGGRGWRLTMLCTRWPRGVLKLRVTKKSCWINWLGERSQRSISRLKMLPETDSLWVLWEPTLETPDFIWLLQMPTRVASEQFQHKLLCISVTNTSQGAAICWKWVSVCCVRRTGVTGVGRAEGNASGVNTTLQNGDWSVHTQQRQAGFRLSPPRPVFSESHFWLPLNPHSRP